MVFNVLSSEAESKGVSQAFAQQGTITLNGMILEATPGRQGILSSLVSNVIDEETVEVATRNITEERSKSV